MFGRKFWDTVGGGGFIETAYRYLRTSYSSSTERQDTTQKRNIYICINICFGFTDGAERFYETEIAGTKSAKGILHEYTF
jgi:hypothetical protein